MLFFSSFGAGYAVVGASLLVGTGRLVINGRKKQDVSHGKEPNNDEIIMK